MFFTKFLNKSSCSICPSFSWSSLFNCYIFSDSFRVSYIFIHFKYNNSIIFKSILFTYSPPRKRNTKCTWFQYVSILAGTYLKQSLMLIKHLMSTPLRSLTRIHMLINNAFRISQADCPL